MLKKVTPEECVMHLDIRMPSLTATETAIQTYSYFLGVMEYATWEPFRVPPTSFARSTFSISMTATTWRCPVFLRDSLHRRLRF